MNLGKRIESIGLSIISCIYWIISVSAMLVKRIRLYTRTHDKVTFIRLRRGTTYVDACSLLLQSYRPSSKMHLHRGMSE